MGEDGGSKWANRAPGGAGGGWDQWWVTSLILYWGRGMKKAGDHCSITRWSTTTTPTQVPHPVGTTELFKTLRMLTHPFSQKTGGQGVDEATGLGKATFQPVTGY